MPGREHCERHHERRRETWRHGRSDYRQRQKARTVLLTGWARLLNDNVAPACGEAYRQNDLAMDALERLEQSLIDHDDQGYSAAYTALADALDATRAVLAESNTEVMQMQRLTGPLPLVIDPPPRPRESRATRLRREEELPG